MDTDINAAAQRLLNECDLYEPDDTTTYVGDLDSSLPHFEDDIRTVASWVLGAGEQLATLREALDAMEWRQERNAAGSTTDFCPVCGGCVGAYQTNERIQSGRHGFRSDGHRKTCGLAAALDVARTAPPTVAPHDAAEGEA